MSSRSALVPVPVARLNRGLLGLRVALYAIVLFGLASEGASPWVLAGISLLVAVPALRIAWLVHWRVHLGVLSSIVLESVLWYVYGPVVGLDFVPIVSVSVAALLLAPRAAAVTWSLAVGLQAGSVMLVAVGVVGGGTDAVRDELVALLLIAMVGPAFRGIASVLVELQSELAEKAKTEARLTELVAEKDRFLEGAAHTLRTPLTGMLGLAEVVETSEMDEAERRELVATIIAEGRRLVRAVDNVIVGSRLPMGRVELLTRSVDLATAAKAAAGDRAEVIGSGHAVGDPARVVTIIGNLVDNAEMHGSGAITVEVGESDGCAWFEVADEGAGVASGQREIVFERYDSQANGITQPAPMGLGLSVSRGLMRAMGGDLECVGAGNRFRGWLPREHSRIREPH